jgi:hypothetical protein
MAAVTVPSANSLIRLRLMRLRITRDSRMRGRLQVSILSWPIDANLWGSLIDGPPAMESTLLDGLLRKSDSIGPLLAVSTTGVGCVQSLEQSGVAIYVTEKSV